MIPGSLENGYSAIYRQKGLQAPISYADPDIRTVRDIIDQCARKYGEKNGFGKITNIQDKFSSTHKKIKKEKMLNLGLSLITLTGISMKML